MTDVAGIRIDEGLADILTRLKKANIEQRKEKEENEASQEKEDDSPKIVNPLEGCSTQILSNKMSLDIKEDAIQEITKSNFQEADRLPWFDEADIDTSYIHYITITDEGLMTYGKVKADKSAGDIAALKLKNDYVCDITYFKSPHYVLCVNQTESNYPNDRVFTATNESLLDAVADNEINKDDVTVEETILDDVYDDAENFTNTDNVSDLVEEPDSLEAQKEAPVNSIVADNPNNVYTHYTVYTDTGVIDFVARQSDVYYPSGNLNGWLEETSNQVIIKKASFRSNKNDKQQDAVKQIKDYTYNLITMQRPGVFTLDSIDNEDPEYQIHIKLKDEYVFVPTTGVIGCLKHYANGHKDVESLKCFLNMYFDVLV